MGHRSLPSKTKQGSLSTCQLSQAPANALTLSGKIPYPSVSSAISVTLQRRLSLCSSWCSAHLHRLLIFRMSQRSYARHTPVAIWLQLKAPACKLSCQAHAQVLLWYRHVRQRSLLLHWLHFMLPDHCKSCRLLSLSVH